MKIISIYVIDLELKTCMSKEKLDFLNMFHRSSAKELLREFALYSAEHLGNPERKIIEHTDYMFICQRNGTQAIIIVTDKEYPSRVSFEIILNIQKNPTSETIQNIIEKRQDGLDNISRIKSTIGETMVIAHENIDKILQRGHDIDELVEKSQNLSMSSKIFYKTAKKHNSCCVLS